MRRTRWMLAVLGGGLLVASGARAGLLDSPPPVLSGTAASIVYRMGPVHYDPGTVDTVVRCTNLSEGTAPIAVELFDDRDAASGLLVREGVPAGQAAEFSTSSTSDIPGASGFSGLAPIQHGKARVSSTTSRLACTAWHVIRSADGSSRKTPLELVKKVALGPS